MVLFRQLLAYDFSHSKRKIASLNNHNSKLIKIQKSPNYIRAEIFPATFVFYTEKIKK